VKKPITNMAASVHARLLKKAKLEARPMNELLQYYAMERFLYRLSRSQHSESFVLKGALLLPLWGGPATRATKDIDLLGRTKADIPRLVAIMSEWLQVEVDDDGVRFDARTVRGEEIRIAAEYGGIRIRLQGALGNARLALQVDVGFGDVVTPRPAHLLYPSLLDADRPRLLAYTPETSIAEKLHAMVILDTANTRLKDFLDIWLLTQARTFSAELVARAIAATFKRRKTPLPTSAPVALTPAFAASAVKQLQWQAYVRKARATRAPEALADAVTAIRSFVMPVLDALAAAGSLDASWRPGGPWSTWDPSGPTVTAARRFDLRWACDGVKRPRAVEGYTDDEPNALAPAELAAVLDAFRSSDTDRGWYPMVMVLAYTGLRPAEVAALKWGDLDLETGALRAGRTVYRGRGVGARQDRERDAHGGVAVRGARRPAPPCWRRRRVDVRLHRTRRQAGAPRDRHPRQAAEPRGEATWHHEAHHAVRVPADLQHHRDGHRARGACPQGHRPRRRQHDPPLSRAGPRRASPPSLPMSSPRWGRRSRKVVKRWGMPRLPNPPRPRRPS
jgi:integrase